MPVYEDSYRWFTWMANPLVEEELVCLITQDRTEQKLASALSHSPQDGDAAHWCSEEAQQLLRRLAVVMQEDTRHQNLAEVLKTTVEEVQQFLQNDRVAIYRFNPDWSGIVITESVSMGWMPIVGRYFQDSRFGHMLPKGCVLAIADIHGADLDNCHINLLEQLQVKAHIVVPIWQGELWGLLLAHHCSSPREWHEFEVDALQQVSGQLAIAIQRSTLPQETQTDIACQLAEAQEREAQRLEITLCELKNAQAQLIHPAKMISVNQLVAGVAHEINNPLTFIHGNISSASEYIQDLIRLIELYQQHYPVPHKEIKSELQVLDIDFLKADFLKLLSSMKTGVERIKDVVIALQQFSPVSQVSMKKADIHSGINSTLEILQNRLQEQPDRAAIEVVKEFGKLPLVKCYSNELNQVFLNILTNAIDAVTERMETDFFTPKIWIRTTFMRSHLSLISSHDSRGIDEEPKDRVVIRIADNGAGISPQIEERIFEPFFTTKPVGTKGLGLAISQHIIVEKHQGTIKFKSQLGKGTEFIIKL